mgnify:CR=1 FL=1
MKDAYEREKERESLPYHNRNLYLGGPKEVAKFLDIFEAIAYCDERPKESLITANEDGYFVVYDAGGN